MLTFMREKRKFLQWMLVAVIASLVGWHFGIGLGAVGMGNSANHVAVVGEHAITLREYQDSLRRLDRRYRELLGENYERMVLQLRPHLQTLDQLIERKLALSEAERVGLEASPEEVRDLVMEQFSRNGRFVGAAQMDRMLARQRITRAQYEMQVAEEIVYRKLRTSVENAAVVTPEEIREEYIRSNNKLTADYVVFDPAEEIPEQSPSTKVLERWFRDRKDDYGSYRSKGLVTLVPTEVYRDAVELDEARLRDYYDSQQRFGRYAEKRRARHILLRVEEDADEQTIEVTQQLAEELANRARLGDDFATLASENSEDPGSATKGGDLGFFPRGSMVPPFEEAVFSAQPGEIAGPIRTSFGFHVILLEEIQPPQAFADVEQELRQELTDREALQLARQAATDLIDASREQGLEQAASEAGLTSLPLGPVSDDETEVEIPGVEPARAAAALKAFQSLTEPGVYDSPVSAGPVFVVLAVEERDGPFEREFDAVRERVEQDYQQERAEQVVTEKLERFSQTLESGSSFAEAVGAADLELKTASDLREGQALPGLPESQELVRQAFEADAQSTLGPQAAGNRHAALLVQEKFSFDQETFEGERDSITQGLRQERAGNLWSGFIRQLRQDLTRRGKLRILQDEEHFADAAPSS